MLVNDFIFYSTIVQTKKIQSMIDYDVVMWKMRHDSNNHVVFTSCLAKEIMSREGSLVMQPNSANKFQQLDPIRRH